MAQTDNKQNVVAEQSREMDDIERALKRPAVAQENLKDRIKQIHTIKTGASDCAAEAENELEKLNQDLTKLGPPVKDESAAVTKTRAALSKEQAEIEKRAAACRLLLLRSDELLGRIASLQSQFLAQRLLDRGPTFTALMRDNWRHPGVWITSAHSFLRTHSGVEKLSTKEYVLLVLVLVAALGLGVGLRWRLSTWAEKHRWDKQFAGIFSRALVTTWAHYAPHLFFSVGAALFLYVVTHTGKPIPFLNVLAYGLPVYFLLVTSIQLFLAPTPPAQPLHTMPADITRALAQRLKVLGLLIFLGYLIFSTLLAQALAEPVLLFARDLYAAVFTLNLIWAVWLLDRIPRLSKTRWLRAVLVFVLVAALVAEFLGYRNLSFFVLRALLGTAIVLGLLRLVGRLLKELFTGLDEGRRPWHRRLRTLLGLKSGVHVPGLIWLRAIIVILLWTVFALALLRIWGMSAATMQQIQGLVVDGFTIGSLKIVPTRIMWALVIFALLYTVSGWIRNRLERRWLPKVRMDRGAREATVTISGYVGTVVALLVALGVAGMEFTNLAIIAGALSVGIGFGLQNIVNNFVSGLILLFERPIKTGDWIIVGNTEGYVKRIRIRSTQIQTFDRADVIVPNSELISGQVTNWMLYDPRGRVRIPVGVAYGSDTQKVKEILLAVAREHPDVIADGSAPEPRVLFLQFGESSLDFELRCFIREIDRRLGVRSDLNFAIDAAFREQGVEIPFPQRDIHVRNWPSPPPKETG